jgi:hypothetical protein
MGGALSDGDYISTMKHTIYQHPITHRFALIRLPAMFFDGDKVPVPTSARWFGTREEALATLWNLFDEDEDGHIEDSLH